MGNRQLNRGLELATSVVERADRGVLRMKGVVKEGVLSTPKCISPVE